MDINVALSPHFERFVRDQIKTGRYNNVSEVIHAGLQLLEDAERRNVTQLLALRADITAGKESGKALDAEPVFTDYKQTIQN